MSLKCQLILIVFCAAKFVQTQDVFLSNTTRPTKYEVTITTKVPAADVQFTGVVSVIIEVLEKTNDIFLHSRQHIINKCDLYEIDGTTIPDVGCTRENDDVIKITSQRELQVGSKYELIMSYQGSLQLTLDGFFRSDYVTRENESDVFTRQAATSFRPFSAHQAFPCYDSLRNEHRATFVVTINRDAAYTAISNEDIQPSSQAQIDAFWETKRLPPSSLAFFISGFERKTETTISGIRHIVSVRKEEMDYTAKLFEMTSTILDSVESFMNVKHPNSENLHSVALPNFQLDVESFYSFNYYREDLILFNPDVSQFSKEFAISKLITNGIVSQFLGNIVTLNSWNDAWIFKGLTKFLEYEIGVNDAALLADEMFISEVLHPILKLESFSSDELPFSADEALSEEVAKKAACVFRMIYHAIGKDAFAQTLHRLIDENSFKSISLEIFYETLQEVFDVQNDDVEIDLRAMIEGFIRQKTNTIVSVDRQNGNFLQVIKTPIALPFNFITSSMEEVGLEWLGDNLVESFIIPSLDDEDWIVANVDQLGFYRVQYDNNNWNALINAIRNNSQIFSSRTKAQLIDDALSLAIDGFLSTNIALDLVMEMRDETSFLPWNAATKNLLHLSNLLPSSEVQQDFQEFALELSENFMQHIGFDDRQQEETPDKLSRIQMIDFACRMKSEECLDHMHSKIKSHIDYNVKWDVNSESSVFCYGLMASALSGEGSQLFLALWNEMYASDDTEYRLRIINALGCFGNVDALTGLLEITHVPTVRYLPGERFQVIQSVFSGSVEGVEATMDFMTSTTSDVVASSETSNLIEILVENLSKRIFNERLLDKFNVMLEALNVPSEQSAHAVQVIRANIDWKESDSAISIINMLIGQRVTIEPPPTSTTSTTTTDSTTTATLAASNIALSTVLGLLCAIMCLI